MLLSGFGVTSIVTQSKNRFRQHLLTNCTFKASNETVWILHAMLPVAR